MLGNVGPLYPSWARRPNKLNTIQPNKPKVYLKFKSLKNKIKFNSSKCKWLHYRSTVAQMAERVPQDQKVKSSNPALDPMRHVSK